ncbi:uncharacterized protein [Physcomitrium patens]|nr:uncharacterized protein LOC112288046 [Physcomitrium patens]XP_024387593.1 uncharacterized protein LOC112288046 [Physcomitrium patens]|eukprot:XP_024387592.1 uncharacterized protein LOC112288046 [Physcomitrella patens]
MGNDNLSSPGYRRGSSSPFKRSLSSPDSSWRSLANRHKFLLYMLGLLVVLCTIYLYFAITLGSSDSCSGLGGAQRVSCQMRVDAMKTDSLKAHHRRLLSVEDSDSIEITVAKGSGKGKMKEFMSFVSSVAGRKDLKEKSDQMAENVVTLNGQEWKGDIASFKTMVDSELKRKKPRRPKASHLRGNF